MSLYFPKRRVLLCQKVPFHTTYGDDFKYQFLSYSKKIQQKMFLTDSTKNSVVFLKSSNNLKNKIKKKNFLQDAERNINLWGHLGNKLAFEHRKALSKR